MGNTELIKEIDSLSLSEKLILVEDIWDSIAKENHYPSMPEWHKQELKERYQEYQDGSRELYDWSTVHKELRKKFQ
ncbi:MAG: addiction module protein [Campylobacterales bacterium]